MQMHDIINPFDKWIPELPTVLPTPLARGGLTTAMSVSLLSNRSQKKAGVWWWGERGVKAHHVLYPTDHVSTLLAVGWLQLR